MTEHVAVFDFNGCALRFSSTDRELTDWISSDFSTFAAPAGAEAGISITSVRGETLRKTLPRSAFKTRDWHILPAPPGRRLVWYPEDALCEYEYRARRGLITSPDPDLLKEISYLLILSRAGEELDLRGLHRLHAGALGRAGKALIFCGAQGAGKTTLLLELLKDKDFSLLSDDTPLISAAGVVHPFPARIGLGEDSPHLKDHKDARSFKRRHYRPKLLVDIARQKIAVSGPLPPGLIFKLVRGKTPLFRRPAPFEAAAELGKSLAAGWGVPQMAEYFLRLSPLDLCRKAGILASRLRAAGALLSRTDFIIFETCPDPAANAAALKAFIHSGSGPGGRALKFSRR